MAIERTTSKAKIEVISRGGHLACKVLRVVERLILVSILNRFLVHELVSRIYPKQEHKQRTNNQSRCNAQGTWCNTWHDMRDVICNAYAGSGRKNNEQGVNLSNQVCRCIDEMISVEIDIKITGNGCTVCKWQAKHDIILRLTAQCYLACNKKLCYSIPT